MTLFAHTNDVEESRLLTPQGGENQRTAVVKSEQGSLDTLALFTSGDTISGHVHLSPAPGRGHITGDWLEAYRLLTLVHSRYITLISGNCLCISHYHMKTEASAATLQRPPTLFYLNLL